MSNKIIAKDEALKCYAQGKKVLAVDTEENLTYTLDELLPEELTYILVDSTQAEGDVLESQGEDTEKKKAGHKALVWSQEDKEQLQQLLNQKDTTVKRIAEYFSVSEQTIRNVMKKWGMTRGI